ncbi:lipopolysaccharide/colanic/teichoic acid biosynthesis glycosyltransferase [Pedobacter sp. UYEF25]
MYINFLKPLLDFLIAALVLLLLFPVLLVVTIWLYFANDGKPFFYQARPGKNGKIFKIVKYKTMNDEKDINGLLLPDSERLTPIGSFVRRTSLDELPQLLNVLKGDMSLVGPRPLLPEYLPLYSVEQQKRHLLNPGITGWAQVNGRNAIAWEQKFNYDVWYVENVSFLLDLNILWMTVKKVVVKEGISSDSSVTMEKFNGN